MEEWVIRVLELNLVSSRVFKFCFIFSTSSKMWNCESESGTFIYYMVSIGYSIVRYVWDVFGVGVFYAVWALYVAVCYFTSFP